MADLANDFSWSRTRDTVFQECRRRYYYQYYGAWGGWDANADARARAFYMLKQLGTRQMWAGRLVHEAVERSLLALRVGHALSEASLIDDTVRQMREEWKGSRDHVYRESPKRTGLFEHEYGVPVEEQRVAGAPGSRHPLPQEFPPAAAPGRDQARVHGPVDPDRGHRLVRLGGDQRSSPRRTSATGTRRIVSSSSTGRRAATETSASLQLGGYALYALEVLGVALPRVDLLEVNLREASVASHPWDEVSLERVREHIRLSARSMKAYLKDPERNIAEEANFEKTEDLRICRWCNFRGVCRPELPPFAESASPQEAQAR